MKYSKKEVLRIILVYSLVVCISNIISVFIPALIQSTGIRGTEMVIWLQFLDDYSALTNGLQLLTFILPAIFCFIYPWTQGKNMEAKLVNLPFVFSLIGISGWVIYMIEEFLMLNVARSLGYDVQLQKIFSSSVMFILLEATIAFTLSFFLLRILHEKWFLKKYYPEGEFLRLKGLRYPSTNLLFFVNYVSASIFPVLFLIYVLMMMHDQSGLSVHGNIYVLLIIICLVGIITTVSFSKSISTPMAKLKERINSLKEGDFNSKVEVFSNDGFGELSAAFNDMTESISSKNQHIQEIQNSIIESIAMMVESRDNSTGGHIKRTSECIKVFIEALKSSELGKDYSENFCKSLIKAAPMHDLGKIAVDDAILRKPGKFEPAEYEIMKSHSAEGAKIVEKVLKKSDDEEFKVIARNVAHYHHEKWNGQGYPCGLKEKEIPLEARIMAFADVFDALVSKRCYKDAFSFDRAFEIIQADAGTHFDPELAPAFLKARPELEKLYQSLSEFN